MATEYKLSYTATQINEKLGKIVDLDTTLTVEGAASDAKSVGNALALKADKTEIPSVNGLASKSYVITELDKKANMADLGAIATKDIVAKIDLESSVQSSLDKADSALQSYTETDPTVPEWAKNANKPTYTAAEVGAVAKSELTAVVNTALAQAKASGEFDGKDGKPGEDGYTPIKGVDYFDGNPGKDGTDGQDGYTPVKGKDYFDGKDGQDGSDGVSATHSWNGTVLTVTSASGTSSADLKGEKGDSIKGDKGDPGADGVSPTVAVSKSGKTTTVTITDKNGTKTATIVDGADGSSGKDGTSVTVKSVSESTADGGSNVVTFSDGKTVTIKNGSKGSTGSAGSDASVTATNIKNALGYTPANAETVSQLSEKKTAYEYAQAGGYTGTETEFAKKLATEYNPNPLYGKKVSFLGDSICAGNSANGTLGGYGKIIADRNNMTYENLAQGGSTITAETYSSSTGTAKGWISRMVDNMSADADYAIVEGGVNDAWQHIDHGTIIIGEISDGYNAELDDTTYYGAFESMLKKLIAKFKGKKIGYIAIPKTMSLYDSSQNAPNFYHIALECCAKWGVSVCDLNTVTPPTECLGTDYVADGTHPTYEGYLKYYCDPIEAWMKTLTTGGNVSAGGSVEAHNSDSTAHADIRALITALQSGKLSNQGVSFRKAHLPLADGTILEIDVLTALDGTVVIPFVNQIPLSVDTDKVSIYGADYNGNGTNDGYLNGYRLSSSGSTKTISNPGAFVTGFIPAKPGDIIYYSGFPFFRSNPNNASDGAGNYLIAYDADMNMLGAITGNHVYYGEWLNTGSLRPTTDFEIADGETWTMSGKITLNNTQAIAYIRMNCHSGVASEPVVSGADAIITVNEEIT